MLFTVFITALLIWELKIEGPNRNLSSVLAPLAIVGVADVCGAYVPMVVFGAMYMLAIGYQVTSVFASRR